MLLGGSHIAEAILAGAKSFPGPHGQVFLTVDADPNGVISATAGSIAILRSGLFSWVNSDGAKKWELTGEWVPIVVASDPNGVVTAKAGRIAVLGSGGTAWINVDGATAWKKIGEWAPPWLGQLTVYKDIDFRTVTPIDIKAGGDVSFVREGLTFTPVNTATCSSCLIDGNGLLIGGKGTSGDPYQQPTPPGCSILFTPREVFGNVGLVGIREVWSWYAFENDENSASRDWNSKSGGFRHELVLDGIQRSYFSACFGVSGTSAVTFPKRMSAKNNVGTSTRDPLNELVVPSGEIPVFAIVQKFGGLRWEVYVGSTVNGKQWPERKFLKYLHSFRAGSLADFWVDATATTTALDYLSSAFYRNRMVSGCWRGGAAPQTWINIVRLKIEAELLP
jgi:hypothetical protein